MHIDPLEKRFLAAAAALVAVFLVSVLYSAFVLGVNPPSTVEGIDSASLHLSEEFAEDRLGVRTNPDGSINVTVVAARYGFHPREIAIPADTPVTFRIASADVLHGVHMPMTNMNTMVTPGYVSQVTTTFPEPGEYPMLCNEYCGLGHDHMWGRINVIAKDKWQAGKN